MPPTAPHEVTVEKTPAYFISKEAPERIKNFNPAMKLIIVLRDPVIRAISGFLLFWFMLLEQHETTFPMLLD